jgi:hypothetical protein
MSDPWTFLEDGPNCKPDKGGRVRWYGRAWMSSLRTRRFWALGPSKARARKRWHAVPAEEFGGQAARRAGTSIRPEGPIPAIRPFRALRRAERRTTLAQGARS